MNNRYATFDFRNPDYAAVFEARRKRLEKLRAGGPDLLALMKLHYKNNPVDFIMDWGVTSDPRNLEIGQPVLVPLILFPRQVEFCEWILTRWSRREGGLSDKSRDMGLSWVSVALACTLLLFNNDMVIGYGSRKMELVDKSGDPQSLFWKARQFLQYLPKEFKGGFRAAQHATYMKIAFPGTNSVLRGEGGDNMGRGGRTSIYFVDEAAFVERPQLVDAALSQTTNCRIDISSVNGSGTPFHEKRFKWPAERIFTFHWRDDPRKTDSWYAKQCADLNPIIVAQEIDLDYGASKEGVLIPGSWIQAAVDLHKHLNIVPSGERVAALDVADQGADLNAMASRKGICLDFIEPWSGKGGTIYKTTLKAINICHDRGWPSFRYDSDGLGAGVRGDAQVINEEREKNRGTRIRAEPFHGSGAVIDPLKQAIGKRSGGGVKGRTNDDLFANRKAQGWWHLRMRFEAAFKATQGEPYDPDMLISLDRAALGQHFGKLVTELNQPTYTLNTIGKIIVDKAPEGAASPNLADGVMIAYAPVKSSGFF